MLFPVVVSTLPVGAVSTARYDSLCVRISLCCCSLFYAVLTFFPALLGRGLACLPFIFLPGSQLTGPSSVRMHARTHVSVCLCLCVRVLPFGSVFFACFIVPCLGVLTTQLLLLDPSHTVVAVIFSCGAL